MYLIVHGLSAGLALTEASIIVYSISPLYFKLSTEARSLPCNTKSHYNDIVNKV